MSLSLRRRTATNFLGRDEEFLRAIQNHGASVVGGALLINAMPKLLKPVAGILIKQICHIYFKRVAAICLPLIKQRLGCTARSKMNPNEDWDPPVGSHMPNNEK